MVGKMKWVLVLVAVLLVVVGIGGWGLVDMLGHAEQMKQRTIRIAAKLEADARQSKAGGRPAQGDDEAQRIARVKEWLMAESSPLVTVEREAAARELAGVLSLDAVRKLLADEAALGNVMAEDRLNAEMVPRYPWRKPVVGALWERYGLLAPEEALAKCAEQPWQERVDPGAVLGGVAQTDPLRPRQWIEERKAAGEGVMARDAELLMESLVAFSPDEAFATLMALADGLHMALYPEYAKALGDRAQVDWEKEVRRISEEGFVDLLRDAPEVLAGTWARSDPDAAFAWLKDSDEPLLDCADALVLWMNAEPVEARVWLEERAQEEFLQDEFLMRALAARGGVMDRETVHVLLELMEDPARREKAVITGVLFYGSETKREDLEHLLESPLVSEKAKREVEAALEKRR
jgi:hypothetical protein